MFKRILKFTLLALTATAIAFVGIWAYNEGRAADEAIICRGIKIEISDSDNYAFVSESELIKSINSEFGKLEGKRLKDIDIEGIELFVDERSAIRKSQVYTKRDSLVHIRVDQRYPVMRLQKGDASCYCDDKGNLFPLEKRTSARVLLVEGNIPVNMNSLYDRSSSYRQQWLKKMLDMVNYIENNDWAGRISYIHVNSGSELVLYMTGCHEKIIFGTADNIEDKFERIKTWYTSVKPQKEENYYSSVNVKFDRQIICRK